MLSQSNSSLKAKEIACARREQRSATFISSKQHNKNSQDQVYTSEIENIGKEDGVEMALNYVGPSLAQLHAHSAQATPPQLVPTVSSMK